MCAKIHGGARMAFLTTAQENYANQMETVKCVSVLLHIRAVHEYTHTCTAAIHAIESILTDSVKRDKSPSLLLLPVVRPRKIEK